MVTAFLRVVPSESLGPCPVKQGQELLPTGSAWVQPVTEWDWLGRKPGSRS